MTADGFLAQKQRHPLAMTAAIAINVAGVTAVMLAKSGVIPVPPNVIETYFVEEDKPPPRHVDPPKPKQQVPETKPIFQPDPIESHPIKDGPAIASTKDPIFDEGHYPPFDPGPKIEPRQPLPPAPVTIDAEPDARFAGDFQPPYPPQLLRTGVEGKTVIKVLIGADGRVKQVAIVSTDDPLFADAAERQALRRWRFRPATRDGTAIESWKQMTVRFEIRA
jgi:protein TonB